MINWIIIVWSILLEVFGISLVLNWLIESGRERRLEPRHQIALRRLFTAVGRDSFLELARINAVDEQLPEEEQLRLRAKGMVLPATNFPLDKYILQMAARVQLSSKEIENLIDRFGDLFEIEFLNDLFQLGEIAYYIIQDAIFLKSQAHREKDETVLIRVAEKVNETFDLHRLKMMQSCTKFIVERIHPQASTDLQAMIRWHLLNFYVGYYPEICDLVLKGTRMKIGKDKKPVLIDLT
ncbi:MAG: hypothetical protein ACE5H4_10605 [Candidatus Thorarchaeota archaeon]